MPEALRLLCVLAHPDDESLGAGGLLAESAASGIETHLVTATRGERGRIGAERPGPDVAGPIRERELRAAARVLGVSGLELLGYLDGDLDRADPLEATARIAAHVRRIRPQVVVTFASEGSYGHPDHIAISQLTGSALVAAADAGFEPPAGLELPAVPHRVSKLYWLAWDRTAFDAYERAIGGRLTAKVDGVERLATPWPDWLLNARVDAREHWRTVWEAVQCHASQVVNYAGFPTLTDAEHRELWGRQSFYRVWSLVNGGREIEADLFEGLRQNARPAARSSTESAARPR